jgi:hypothetical protein
MVMVGLKNWSIISQKQRVKPHQCDLNEEICRNSTNTFKFGDKIDLIW